MVVFGPRTAPVETHSELVAVAGITVTYKAAPALFNVGFSLVAGESLAIMGPNGSGKTTLLHVLAGLVEPDSGKVVTAQRPAYVLQRRHQHRWMPLSVSEILEMGRLPHVGLLRPMNRTDKQIVKLSAERLQIEDLMSSQFGTLSGGQQQRVLIAQALAQESKILMMDEPITGLDPVSQQLAYDAVSDELAKGSCVVITTHHMAEAVRCDKIALLNNSLTYFGPSSGAFTEENLRTTFGAQTIQTSGQNGALIVDEHSHAADGCNTDDPNHLDGPDQGAM